MMPSLSWIDRTSPLYRRIREVRSGANRIRYRTPGVHRTAFLSPGCHLAPDLVADEHVFVGPGCSVEAGVTLGKWTMLAADVAIVGADHRMDEIGVPMQFAGREPLLPTRVGRDCWIGHGAKVMVGTTIGDFAIVAAGSVVTRDVPEGVIVGGVPARVLRDRFDRPDLLDEHRRRIEEWAFDGSYSGRRRGLEQDTARG
jgi:acetyltransferase-like isoleucine patch superfamily enzyme